MATSAIVGILKVLLTADTAEYDSAMKRVNVQAQQWSRDLGTMGRQASAMGASLTKTLTLPILGLGTAAAKASMDFESSFAGVRKTVNATEPEFAAMSQSFRELAKTIPINVNELNRLGEAAGALGIPKAEIVDFARVMALLGVTTNVTSDEAASSIGKIQNIFGAAGKDTERFASTLVDLGNKGASTEGEILALATRLASAGHTAGLSQGEVLAFASAIANVGIEAEAGGSAMSKVFNDMGQAVSKGGAELEVFARVAGLSVDGFAHAFRTNAADAMRQFIEGLGRVKKSGQDLNIVIDELGFSEIRQSNLLRSLALSGDNLANSLKTQASAWEENKALSTEAGERFKTTHSQLTLLWNRITDVAITFGNALLPMIKATVSGLNGLIPVIERMANGFAMMPVPLQASVVGFGLLIAAAGPLLWVFGQLLTAAASVSAAFTVNGIATKGLGVAYTGLTAAATAFMSVSRGVVAAFAALSAPIAGVIIGVGALAYAWASFTGDWTRAFDVLIPPLGLLRAGWDSLSKAIAPHKQLLQDVATIISSSLTVAWFLLKNVLKDVTDWVENKVVWAWTQVKSAVAAVVDWVGTKAVWAFNELKKAAADIPGFRLLLAIFERMQATGQTAKVVIHELAQKFGDVSDAITNVEKPAVAASGALKDINDRAIKPLTTGLELFNLQGQNAGPVMASLIAKSAGYTAELQAARTALASLTKEQRDQITAGLALGKSTEQIAKDMSLSESVVKMFKESIEDLGKAEKKRTDDAVANLKKLNELEGKIVDENAKFRAEAVRGFEEQTAAMKAYWQAYDNARGEQSMKDALYWQNWATNSTGAIHKALVGLKETVEENSPKPEWWSQAWGGMKSGLYDTLKGVPQTLANAFTGGGDIWGAVKSIGTQIGSTIGGSIGFALSGGSPLGQAVGSAVGSLLGPAMEGFKKLFGVGINEEVRKANTEISKLRDGLLETRGTLDALETAANRVGLSFKENWGHQGQAGLKAMNELIAEFEARTKAVSEASAQVISGFAAVATGMTKPWLALGASIDEAFKKTAEAEAAYKKALDSDASVAEIQKLQAAFYEASEAEQALYQQQWDMAQGAKQQLADLGVQAVATFGAALMAGESYGEAMKKVGPSLTTLGDSYKALGLEVEDVGLKNLILQATVAKGNPELIAAVDGLSGSMNGLAQLGLLNIDTFAAMQRTGSEMYSRLQTEVAAVGGSTRDALLPMQGYLQEAAAKAEMLGIPLEANTQILIDQSKELGLWKERAKSSTDRVIDGMQALVDKVSLLIDKILGVGDAIGDIPSTKVITFQAQYSDPGPPSDFGAGSGTASDTPTPSTSGPRTYDLNGDGRDENGYRTGTWGRLGQWYGNFPQTGMSTVLHGMEAVITPNQAPAFALDTLAGMGFGAGGAADDSALLSRKLDSVRGAVDRLGDRLGDRIEASFRTAVAQLG